MAIQMDPNEDEKKYLHKFADFANKRVLEIGCGDGRLTWQYAHASSLTVGLDPDQDALRLALVDAPSDLENKVFFTRAQSEHLPFSKEKFDLAVLSWSL